MIEFLLAFGAGLISFLSPCVLPLIPGYISYISGSSINELIEKKNINLIPIILFTVGFSIVSGSGTSKTACFSMYSGSGSPKPFVFQCFPALYRPKP